jgi:Holliday junction resolvase RusA-like endonuclease
MIELNKNKKKWGRMNKLFAYPFPLVVSFKIYRKTHRRFDYCNIIQLLCDCMVKAGYFPDDDAKHFIPYFFPYEKDKENPRVEIDILKGF